MFGATLPASGIIPGVTTGHIGHHHLLHEFFNAFSTFLVAPGASGADIASALADAHAQGYGTVKLEGESYTVTGGVGTVALDIYLPTVHLDLNGATLNYTGDGICLRKRMDPFTITNAGYVRNGTIDGSGAGDGAIGIQTGAVIGAGWDGVTVLNFNGVGSINWDLYNEAANTWMERCRWERCDSRNGTIDWHTRAHATSPSMLYNDFADCRFESNGVGQTSIKTNAPAQLYDCQFGFRGNVNEGATVFDLGATTILRPQMDFSVEQTTPSPGPVLDAVLFAPGSDDIIYPRGTMAINNFPDYDTNRQFADYQGRGELITFDPLHRHTVERPYQGFGFSIGAGHLGTYTSVYEGGVGANFALLKLGFEEELKDARVVAELDSVVWAETGLCPGDFTFGAKPAATAVRRGTMIYINDVDGGIPAWSDGTDWRDATGTVIVP